MSNSKAKPEAGGKRDQRILILAPTGRDGELTARFLHDASLSSYVCTAGEDLYREITRGAGLVFLTEEALTSRTLRLLAQAMMAQAAWSDIPIVLLTSGGFESPVNTEALASLAAIGNVNLIERPVRMMSLFSTIKAGLRARNRQYDVRDHIESEARTREELEKALIQIEEASRLKDEFLATVSHELRTPLNAVLGWTTLLRTKSLDQAGGQRALEIIERNARSQHQLVEDLLDVSRAISGKLRLDAGAVEPETFIQEAIEALRPTARARNVTIRQVIEPGLNQVYGDPSRLRQIVWNLLSNAIKFSFPGGRVVLQARGLDSQLEISVKDQGQGIGAEFLPHVFERFRQADMTSTRTHGGLGLGLAIVRQLVELHSGTVAVDSSGPGRGATFVVTLPFLDGSKNVSASLAHRERLAGGANLDGLRVLVVDDEVDTRQLLKTALSKQGARVSTAHSATAALRLISRVKPDVLISDIGMPGADGYELMRRVRLLPRERGGAVPAVALTAYAREIDRQRALQAGYQTYLAKPVELSELSLTVANLIGSVTHNGNLKSSQNHLQERRGPITRREALSLK